MAATLEPDEYQRRRKTFADYRKAAQARAQRGQNDPMGERVGQAHYNELHKFRPELTKRVPSWCDPFYDNLKLFHFLEFVETNWNRYD